MKPQKTTTTEIFMVQSTLIEIVAPVKVCGMMYLFFYIVQTHCSVERELCQRSN